MHPKKPTKQPSKTSAKPASTISLAQTLLFTTGILACLVIIWQIGQLHISETPFDQSKLSITPASKQFRSTFANDPGKNLFLYYPPQYSVYKSEVIEPGLYLVPVSASDQAATYQYFFIGTDDFTSGEHLESGISSPTLAGYEAFLQHFHMSPNETHQISSFDRYAPNKTKPFVASYTTKKLGQNTIYYFNDENPASANLTAGHLFWGRHIITLLYAKSVQSGTSSHPIAFTSKTAEDIISSLVLK